MKIYPIIKVYDDCIVLTGMYYTKRADALAKIHELTLVSHNKYDIFEIILEDEQQELANPYVRYLEDYARNAMLGAFSDLDNKLRAHITKGEEHFKTLNEAKDYARTYYNKHTKVVDNYIKYGTVQES